jgi:hypothetical protein
MPRGRATSASLPRGLECAGACIKAMSTKTCAPTEMFDGLCRALRGTYSTAVSSFTNAKLTYSAIHQSAHQFDSNAVDLVKPSMLTNTMTESDICVAAFPAHIHILPSMNLLLLCLAAEAADRNDRVAAILRDDVIAYIKSALTSDKDNLRSKLTFPACGCKCGWQRLRRWAWKYCFNIFWGYQRSADHRNSCSV